MFSFYKTIINNKKIQTNEKIIRSPGSFINCSNCCSGTGNGHRPVLRVHHESGCRDQRVGLRERRDDVVGGQQIEGPAEVLLQLVLVHAVHVDALHQTRPHETGERALVEPGVLVVHERRRRQAPHGGAHVLQPTVEQRGILHRVEPRHEERRRLGEGLAQVGGDRHLAVRGVVGEDQAIGCRSDDLAALDAHHRPLGVLHDEVRVEGVAGGGGDHAHGRGQEAPDIVVDAHEMLHRGHADAVQRDARPDTRATERDLDVEVRGEAFDDLARQDEALASPARGEEGENRDDEGPLVDDRRRGGQLVPVDAVLPREGAEHVGIPPDLVVDGAAESEDEVSCHDADPPRSVQVGLAGGAEQVDLLGRGHLHRRDRLGLDRVRLAETPVGAEHLAHAVVVRDLDVAGDVDLVDAQRHGAGELGVRVAGSAVQDERDADGGLDLLEQIVPQLGVLVGRVQSVRGADGDRQAVDAGLLDETHRVVDVRVDDLGRARLAVAVVRADRPELALDLDAGRVRRLDDLAGDRDVLLERLERGVDHHRREARVDGRDHLLVRPAVVPVDGDGNARPVGTGVHRGDQIRGDVRHLVGVDGDDDRGGLLFADVHDPGEHRPVGDVEGRDGEAVGVRHVEDGLAGVEHGFLLVGVVVESQLFTEPAVRPLMKKRWKKRKRTSTGIEPRMLIAMIWFHSYECWPMSSWMPIGTVRMSRVRVRVSAKRNSFHAIMNV